MRKRRAAISIDLSTINPIGLTVNGFVLIMGIACGVMCCTLGASAGDNALVVGVKGWVESVAGVKPSFIATMWSALFAHGRLPLLLAVAGWLSLGTLMAPLSFVVKGFSLGVVAGGLCVTYGWQCVGFLFVVLVPSNLMFIACQLWIADRAAARPKRYRNNDKYLRAMAEGFIFFAIGLILETVLLCTIIPSMAMKLMGG